MEMDLTSRRVSINKTSDADLVGPGFGAGQLDLGIDVGSTSSDLVLLNSAREVIYKDYRRTMGRPMEIVRQQLADMQREFDAETIGFCCFTGSAGRFIASILKAGFVNEVPAQAAAIGFLYPEIETATIIEMGGQDSKLIFLESLKGRKVIKDFALNTVCAAGTGSFLDQQAQRLGINIEEEFGSLALACANPPRVAGRCSVFAKSDMIHLQQLATPMGDILAGLCMGLARNLKSNLGSGRQFVRPVIFTGGVGANPGVRRAIEDVLELQRGELIIPKMHFFTGAIGAVILGRERISSKSKTNVAEFLTLLGESHKYEQGNGNRKALAKPSLPEPASPVFGNELTGGKMVEAYLGVDVGSISTNVVVMDSEKRVLAKAYVMTAGRPLEAVGQGLDIVAPVVAGKVKILGAATTGSGRYLTGDFLGADIVINEITAQAAGAAIVNPDVDTIFEIGGQDSKYIALENGVVVDFEMNHACAAGTGSFLEEQAQRLGINIKGEFSELAFESNSPAKLGERCTVFMESDLLNFQQQGAKTADLVAGLSYSIVTNYLNRVVGRRRIGSNICFQGGTAFNKAVWAAFEMVTGRPIMVPDHHEVTGALGAAYIVMEHVRGLGKKQSSFKGFENLAHANYTVEAFTCEHCSNDCEIKKVQLEGSEPLYYGSRCDRYNLKKEKLAPACKDAFDYRKEMLLKFGGLDKSSETKQGAATIGIGLSLGMWQYLPLFGTFFKELGFNVVTSGQTTKSIIREGVETVAAQTCFPVKVAHGHVGALVDKKVDYIFMPSIVSLPASYKENRHNQLCPYVQSAPYQVKTAFEGKTGSSKFLSPVIRFADGKSVLKKCFGAMAKELKISKSQCGHALNKALEAQDEFEKCCKQKGKEILAGLKPDEKLFILISRPYNGCDPGINLELPKKLAKAGIKVIPLDMLELENAGTTSSEVHGQMYWKYGQHILRGAEVIAADPRLYAIYLSNFSCGPDSFVMTFFKDIMGDKPSLSLELDEHSADAGVITRLEAFFESLKNYKPSNCQKCKSRDVQSWATSKNKRTIYLPYMGDCAHGLASAFKAYGHDARVMPMADEDALARGRKFTTGKECLPCAITAGDMLKVLDKGARPQETAFFMPGSIGPCRFGMYSCLDRLILKQAGYENVPVIAPNQDVNFYDELNKLSSDKVMSGFTKHAWIATVGIDLLGKILLQIRPVAFERHHAQARYEKALKMWLEAVERKASLKQLVDVMEEIAEMLWTVAMDRSSSRPRIGIVGEIYVRSHTFANQHVIEQLEKLGAHCELASLAEWIYYTNFCRGRMARRQKRVRTGLVNMVENFFQHRFEKAIARPLEAKFGPLAEEPIEHVIELAKPYIHESFEGEAILSIGKMVEYHHKGIGGVINVMPFTCMPSTIVSTQTLRISADCGNMPILNLSFDGQSDPTLTTRLEAFVEQVRQRQGNGKSEVRNSKHEANYK